MVPDADFTSYYGRPVVKASPWEADIPAYLFLGGLAGGSSLLGAGADLTGRPVLRQVARWTALGAVTGSFAALVHDLGRPSRFLNMLRVAKPTSPMSMGTWVLTAYAPMAGLAAMGELGDSRVLRAVARPAGLVAGGLGTAVASYTAVLLADTATPTWHESWPELPVQFVGSAASASGGAALLSTPVAQAGPARRLAVGGALVELAASQRTEQRLGVVGEPLTQGKAGTLLKAAKGLTAAGAFGTAVFGRRSRVAAGISGALLVAGSVCTRFGIFEAGQASARDPKYTVVPQRERLQREGRVSVPGR